VNADVTKRPWTLLLRQSIHDRGVAILLPGDAVHLFSWLESPPWENG
jgi:hypothetical protein